MRCDYCGNVDNPADAKKCVACGAPVQAEASKPRMPRAWDYLRFYNGHIVWKLFVLERNTVEYQFWRGSDLLQRMVFDRDMLSEMCGGKPNDILDDMRVVWPLFELAQGERDVLTYTERNNKYPATFEVRRIENKEREDWRTQSLSREQILEIVRR